MGLMDAFKATENEQLKEKIEELEAAYTSENNQLKSRIAELEALLTPEHLDLSRLHNEVIGLNNEIYRAKQDIATRRRLIAELDAEITAKRSQITSFDDELMFESFGLYKPRFNFAKAEYYKSRLDEIRRRQKTMISEGTAVLGAQSWYVNGSASQGAKMVKDMQKLLLRAFNSECDDIVEKVKYNNFDTSVKRIRTSRDAISKLGAMMNISISEAYLNMKIDEITLAFEYATKKQEEKEAEKEARARLREEARLLKEIEEERKRLEKEQTHYQNALVKLNAQLAQNPTAPELIAKKQELEQHIADAEKAIKDVDYREANKRAGYVYVISNVGAFGENVYKIGMTRRLDPQERVDELGDASVPFAFDVHAMIFTDDAPALEAALHRAFENKKVNMVNPRREFFRVSLNEIKEVIRKNYDKTVEFTDIPDAEQWRVSMKMRGEVSEAPIFPNAMPAQSAPRPTASSKTTSLENAAMAHIKRVNPNVACECGKNGDIIVISVKENGSAIGKLRISNRKNKVKYDYAKYSPTKAVKFFGKLEDINSML